MQQHEIITINSRNRVSGTDSNFSYKLRPRNPEFDRVVVLEAHIPKTYYLVQKPYDTFTLTEGNLAATVRVPVGNYTRRSFQTTMARVLSAASPNGWVYTVEYPEVISEADTGKYTYIVESADPDVPPDTEPAFIFASGMFEQMGFAENSVNTFVGGRLTSVNVIKLQIEDTLFLYSDLVGGDNDTNILQELFAADSQNFSSIDWICPAPREFSRRIANTGADSYNFWILDEDGREIDLNGGNVVITLQMFRSTPTLDLLRRREIVELLKRAWQTITTQSSTLSLE